MRPPHDAVATAGTLPSQRVHEETLAAPSRTAAVVLLADPRRAFRVALSLGLRGGGIPDVLEAASVAEVDAVIAHGGAGDLALVSLAFEPTAERLIGELRRAGWPRVLATDRTATSKSVIRAFRAGASGVLLGPPMYRRQHPDAEPIPVLHLSDREIGGSQVRRGGPDQHRDRGTAVPVDADRKSHLARIGRKLGTGDRAQMVAVAMRAGVIG